MPLSPAAVPDRWHSSNLCYGVTAIHSPTAERQFMWPVHFFQDGTVEAMGLYKTNTTNLNDKYQLGIYNSSGGFPATIVTDFGEVNGATASTGVRSVTGTAAVSADTTYWLAVKSNSVVAGTHPQWVCNAAQNAEGGFALMPFGVEAGNLAAYTLTGSSSTVYSVLRYDSKGTGALDTDLSGETPTSYSSSATCPIPVFKFRASSGGPGWGWHGSKPYWQVVGG